MRAALELGVVLDADPGERGDLAAAQPRHPPVAPAGRPACSGVILARRETRNSRTSSRLSTIVRVRRRLEQWGALPVHLSTGPPTTARGTGCDWSASPARVHRLRGAPPCVELCCTPPATSGSRSVPTRRSSSRPTRSSACPRPASAGRTCGPTAASTTSTARAPMGHEYVGIVEEVGAEVTTITAGPVRGRVVLRLRQHLRDLPGRLPDRLRPPRADGPDRHPGRVRPHPARRRHPRRHPRGARPPT